MASEEDKKGAHAPTGEPLPPPENHVSDSAHPESAHSDAHPADSGHATVSYTPTVDDAYSSYDDPYGYDVNAGAAVDVVPSTNVPVVQSAPPPPPAPPAPPVDEDDDEEDDGMLRMSF